MRGAVQRAWKILKSLELTIVCLVALMVLVIWCTLAQVDLGSYVAVRRTMRTMLVWWHVPGTHSRIPIFPGGALVGGLLMVNLVAAQLGRLVLSWKKAGIWIVHLGLILLFAGEFVTGLFQVEMRMAIEEGQTANYIESGRDDELVVADVTDPAAVDEAAFGEALLAREGTVEVNKSVKLNIKAYYRNASLGRRADSDPPQLVTATAGVGASIVARELPPVTSDDEMDTRAVYVEPIGDGRSYGTWLVSNGLGAPQSFLHEGHKYVLSIRPRRQYLPYALTLKKFKHDVYLGTDIPKNFSSLVHISNPGKGEERDVLIYMNQPLRYEGKAFYQASFGKGDTLSILQVVDNPGWRLPYLACSLVALGLLLHFGMSLRRWQRRTPSASEATA